MVSGIPRMFNFHAAVDSYLVNNVRSIRNIEMLGSRKFRQVGGGPENYLSHQRISQRVVRTSLEKQLDPRGPIASLEGGPYQYF